MRPTISATYPLADAREGFAQLAQGDVMGKIVLTMG